MKKPRCKYAYRYKKRKKSFISSYGYIILAVIIAVVFLLNPGEGKVQIIKKQNKNETATFEQQEENVDKTLMTAYIKGKNDNVIDGKAYDYETDLGKRFFDANVKKNGLPDSETIFNIGQKLFGNINFKVSAFYGEYYVVDRDKLNDDMLETGVINDKDNLFGGIHEGLDLVSKTYNSDFYALCDGYLINDGTNDKYNTIAVYNPAKNITVLYLHCRNVYVKMDNETKTYIKTGQKIGSQGSSGLDGNGDHVHIEVARGVKKTAYSSKDNVISALPPYDYVK